MDDLYSAKIITGNDFYRHIDSPQKREAWQKEKHIDCMLKF